MKKFILPVVSICLLIGGSLYFYFHKKVSMDSSTVSSESVYSTKVSGYTISLFKSGTVVQTLKLGEDAVAGMNFLGDATDEVIPFITNQDVNFDGKPDLAMITGIGYGGVNLFYDYYIFDPSTEKFVADPILTAISNPFFDTKKKTISGLAKDGLDMFSTVYTWNGKNYIQGPTVSVTTGAVQTDN